MVCRRIDGKIVLLLFSLLMQSIRKLNFWGLFLESGCLWCTFMNLFQHRRNLFMYIYDRGQFLCESLLHKFFVCLKGIP